MREIREGNKMPEYVSKDELMAFIDKNARKYSITVSNACNFKDFVRMCPAADVAHVVHGKWENSKYMAATKCGVCGEDIFLDDYEQFLEWKYCPICGAKMDLEE